MVDHSAAHTDLVRLLAQVLTVLAVILSGCSGSVSQILPTLAPTPIPPVVSTIIAVSAPSEPTATPYDVSLVITEPVSLAQTGSVASPTPLLGPTPIPVRKTSTPTRQPSAFSSLRVEYFTSEAATIQPGDLAVLLWSVRGVDQAIIYRLDATGNPTQQWKVDRSGRLRVPTSSEDRVGIQFMIVIGDEPNTVQQKITVAIQCGTCSQEVTLISGTQIPTAAAQQDFQQGIMVWIGAEKRIYVLFQDGQIPAWVTYPDSFKDGDQQSDPALQPPSGLMQPIRGFGLVWRTHPDVRRRLGWALNTEVSYDGQIQNDNKTGTLTLRIRDSIITLSDGGKT